MRIFAWQIVLLVSTVFPARAAGDALDALAQAVARFRGVGYADVSSYSVTVQLPEEEDEEAPPLREVWRAPGDIALRAAEESTPRAVVRGLAMYLEPLYVARASLLATDLAASVPDIRASCEVTGDASALTILFGEEPQESLPEELRDLARIEARIGPAGRILSLEMETRETDRIALLCEYAEGRFTPQPERAVWTLPSGELVEITTEFLAHGDRVLPDWRRVRFPSRYDPGEMEEILVEYEDWDLSPDLEDGDFSPPSFRFDGSGLID